MNQLLSEFLKENGEHFTECNVCKKELKNDLYFIEKAYQRNLNGEGFFVLFEFAICSACREELSQSVSQESYEKMQNYMLSHQPEIEENLRNKGFEYCSISGVKLIEGNAYHRVGMIQNGQLIAPPLAMGEEVMEEYQSLLSEKTKEFLDDFYDNYVDVPPALAKLLMPNHKSVLL